jgi:hypothetical protein
MVGHSHPKVRTVLAQNCRAQSKLLERARVPFQMWPTKKKQINRKFKKKEHKNKIMNLVVIVSTTRKLKNSIKQINKDKTVWN